jgi:hypothetical protein
MNAHSPESSEGHASSGHHESYYPPLEPGVKAIVQSTDNDGNNTFRATHRYPNGDYYFTDHDLLVDASNTIAENRQTKDPLREGLYGITVGKFRDKKSIPDEKDQVNNVIKITEYKNVSTRPEESSQEFLESVGTLDSDDIDAIIKSETRSDDRLIISDSERKDIDSKSEPIIASYEARNNALKEGKSIKEAQDIGEKMWRFYHQMGEAPNNPVDSTPSVPETPHETDGESTSPENENILESKYTAKQLLGRSYSVQRMINKIAEVSVGGIHFVSERKLEKRKNKAQNEAKEKQKLADETNSTLLDSQRATVAKEAKLEAAKHIKAYNEFIDKKNAIIAKYADRKSATLGRKAIKREAKEQGANYRERKAVLKEFSQEGRIKVGRIAYMASQELKAFRRAQDDEKEIREESNWEEIVHSSDRIKDLSVKLEEYVAQVAKLEESISHDYLRIADFRQSGEIDKAEKLEASVSDANDELADLKRQFEDGESKIQQLKSLKALGEKLISLADARMDHQQMSDDASKYLKARITQVKAEVDAKNNNEGDK